MIEASARAGAAGTFAGEAADDAVNGREGAPPAHLYATSLSVSPGWKFPFRVLVALRELCASCSLGVGNRIKPSDGSDIIENRASWESSGKERAPFRLTLDKPSMA
jgi:hypothetical protein